MNKINKNRIVSGLGIMAILILGVITIPTETKAITWTSTYGGYIKSGDYNDNNYQEPTYIPAPVYVNPTPTPTVYSSTVYGSATKKVATNKTNTSVAKTTTSNSNLAANALFGSNSFIPSGLIQWILFAILVLFVVILVRRANGGDQRYLASPMKHK